MQERDRQRSALEAVAVRAMDHLELRPASPGLEDRGCLVGGVVDDDDLVVRVLESRASIEQPGDDALFIEGGDVDGDEGLVPDVEVAVPFAVRVDAVSVSPAKEPHQSMRMAVAVLAMIPGAIDFREHERRHEHGQSRDVVPHRIQEEEPAEKQRDRRQRDPHRLSAGDAEARRFAEPPCQGGQRQEAGDAAHDHQQPDEDAEGSSARAPIRGCGRQGCWVV